MTVEQPLPPCKCTDNDNAAQILVFNFIINIASTGVMLMAFLNKIKEIVEQKKYDEVDQFEP